MGGLLIGLAVMASCSEPPVQEHDHAVTALAAARDAGAATYASDQMTAATAALARYDQFVAERDYKQAFGAAIEARDLAFEAGRAAKIRQAELRDDVTRLATLLGAAIVAVDSDLTTRGRVPTRQQAAVRKARTAAAQALQDSRAAAARGEYTAAIARLHTATADLTTIREKAAPAARTAR